MKSTKINKANFAIVLKQTTATFFAFQRKAMQASILQNGIASVAKWAPTAEMMSDADFKK